MIVLPPKISEAKDSDSIFVIELYTIKLRTGMTYIAACDKDITYNGQTYIAIPIQRETITRSVDNVVDNVNLKIADCDEDKLAYIMHGFDFRGCDVLITKVIYPELDEQAYVFSGSIDSPSFADGVFSCVVKAKFPTVQIPSRSCQLPCNCEFGDDECTMSLDKYTISITSATQNSVYIGVAEKDYWKDGVITIDGESRIIRNSDDHVYFNIGFVQTLKPGMMAKIQRGCDKTKKTCKDRYNNMVHYSGFPSIPFESEYR